jgi:xanthine/CO dehydrogenase XdhC/CoxF family maturation factor
MSVAVEQLSATPEELAISIVAQLIAARSGRAGAPLVSTESSIRAR